MTPTLGKGSIRMTQVEQIKLQEAQHAFVKSVLTIAAFLPPEDFKPWFFGGILTNVIGSLPDDYWEAMMISEPCDQLGCDCHKFGEKLMPVLDTMRVDRFEFLPKEKAE